MAKMSLRTRATDDLGQAAIRLDEEDRPLGVIYLEASELEAHIWDLARVRSALRESVTPELEPNARIAAVPDPAWQGQRATMEGYGRMVALAIRHPGLGWVPFALSPERARELADWLYEQLPAAAD